jgi:hypothetical protein
LGRRKDWVNLLQEKGFGEEKVLELVEKMGASVVSGGGLERRKDWANLLQKVWGGERIGLI